MTVVIRPLRDGDVESIVALSLRAWEPVFASIHETVGSQSFAYFYDGDWRSHQASDVRSACSEYEVSVADNDGRVVGFTAVDYPTACFQRLRYVTSRAGRRGAGVNVSPV